MNEMDTAKEFVKKWARLTDGLYKCQTAVLSELVNEPSVRQQAQVILAESLGSPEERRTIALQLAIATSQAPLF